MSTRNRRGRRNQQRPIPSIIWTVLCCLPGLFAWNYGYPMFPFLWLGLLVGGATAQYPMAKSGRRTDPPEPGALERYKRWKDLQAGFKPSKEWIRPQRVSWIIGFFIAFPFSIRAIHPWMILTNLPFAFASVMALSHMLALRADHRHENPGVTLTAFYRHASTVKRVIATIIGVILLLIGVALGLKGVIPMMLALPLPIILYILILWISDRKRQSQRWRRIIEWQERVDDWVQQDGSPIAKAWDSAYITQVSVLGDPDNPLNVIRVRFRQGAAAALKAGVEAVRPLAVPEGYNLVELLEARKRVGNQASGIFDPNSIRLIVGHDDTCIPDITMKQAGAKLATLVTDIAYARCAHAWKKRAPLTKAYDVSADPKQAAWLIELTMPPEGGQAIDLISLNWLNDPQNGPATVIHMPVEADLYDTFHLAADPATRLSDDGNKHRPKGKLTKTKSFDEYIRSSRRYRQEQTVWQNILPHKLTPPTPNYDGEETAEGDGWKAVMLPLSFAPPATVADYARIDLQPLDPQAKFIGLAPEQDGTGMLIKASGNVPTSLDDINGPLIQQRTLVRAIVYRALVDALPAVRGSISIDSCTQEGRGVAIWRIQVTVSDGATIADIRKRSANIQAELGSKYVIWDWRDASTAVLWTMCERWIGIEDIKKFRQARRQKELLPLILSDAWGVAGITDPSGRSPQVTSLGVFPRNHDLLKVRFRIPAGMSMNRIDANTDKFLTAAGYGYGRILPRGDEHGADLWDMALCKHSPFPTMVGADWSYVKTQDTRTLPMGVDDMGEVISWNLKDTYHVAVMGKSGTGKSSAAQIIVADALLHGWQIIIIDPSKGAIDFTQWAQPLALAYVGNGQMDETEAVIGWVEHEMNQRVKMLSQEGAGNINDLPDNQRPPRILVVFDELNGYLTKMGKTAPNPNRDLTIANENARIQSQNNSIIRTMSAMSKIALQGRTAGISLLLGGQRLGIKDFERFPGGSQFYHTLGRLLLGNDTPEGIIAASNIREAHRLQESMKSTGGQVPKGRGLWENMDGRLTAIQTWYGGGQEKLAEAVAGISAPNPIDITPFMPEQAIQLGEVAREEVEAATPLQEQQQEQELRQKVEDAEEISIDDWEL